MTGCSLSKLLRLLLLFRNVVSLEKADLHTNVIPRVLVFDSVIIETYERNRAITFTPYTYSLFISLVYYRFFHFRESFSPVSQFC